MIGGKQNSENTVISGYLQMITAKLNNIERPDKEECDKAPLNKIKNTVIRHVT